MAQTGPYIENYIPEVREARGLNTKLPATFGSTANFTGILTPTGGLAAADGVSTSARLISTGDRSVVTLTAPHSTTVVTTDTYVAEIFIPSNVTVNGISVLMGTTAGNGNLTVGLANDAGTVVAKSATTTTSGTSTTFTQVSFTSAYSAIGPATYYVLVQGSSTSDALGTHVAGNFGTTAVTTQTYGTLANIATSPTTFTANVGPVADLF